MCAGIRSAPRHQAQVPMNEQLATIYQAKSTILDLAVRFGPKVLAAILILIVGVIVSRWVGRWLRHALGRIELEPPVRLLLAGVGVAGAAVALATQGVLSNAAAGLTIIFTKPFRVGQYVSIVGEEGQVDSITLFNTTLSHLDRSLIVIPNRKVVGEVLHNYGTVRQLDIVVGVAYDTELNVALATINEIVRGNSRVLQEPAPVIQTILLGNSAVTVAVRPLGALPTLTVATGEINKAIVETFRGRGIVIPFPQHEVRLIGQVV